MSRARGKEGVGGGAPGPFPVDLRLHPGHFRTQHFQPLLELDDAVKLEIFPDRLGQPLAATHPGFCWFVHALSRASLCRPPQGRYVSVQPRLTQALEGHT